MKRRIKQILWVALLIAISFVVAEKSIIKAAITTVSIFLTGITIFALLWLYVDIMISLYIKCLTKH